jgi:cysteinyl-tRNA synthetase
MDQLKVHNSLKPGAPVPFVPKEEGKVSWYVCGPTVYDHSHLGHARNYVSTDIIRRIVRDYFGYKLKFVMNITDVDDKVPFYSGGQTDTSSRDNMADHSKGQKTKATGAGEDEDVYRTRALEPGYHGL